MTLGGRGEDLQRGLVIDVCGHVTISVNILEINTHEHELYMSPWAGTHIGL